MMNNNTVNEISTNVSPTQSPSKYLRLRCPVDQKNHFSNFAHYLFCNFLQNLPTLYFL